jgi:hypothetical protein
MPVGDIVTDNRVDSLKVFLRSGQVHGGADTSTRTAYGAGSHPGARQFRAKVWKRPPAELEEPANDANHKLDEETAYDFTEFPGDTTEESGSDESWAPSLRQQFIALVKPLSHEGLEGVRRHHPPEQTPSCASDGYAKTKGVHLINQKGGDHARKHAEHDGGERPYRVLHAAY